ncbi:MAG: hotdog fold thioesterase [Actinobacteria bacterium]|nr:hotdog fold thioesterase [Actinomycetota bacterium]
MSDEPHEVPSWPEELPPPEVAAAAMTDNQGALGATMGIEYLHVAPDLVTARMPVLGNTQPYGLLHGGASGVLAESVGSIAASLHGGPGRIALGIELNLSHHRGVREGFVHATATPLSVGRTLASFAIAITDDQDRPVCTARLTCLLRDA